MDAITYPSWDLSWTMLVNWAPGLVMWNVYKSVSVNSAVFGIGARTFASLTQWMCNLRRSTVIMPLKRKCPIMEFSALAAQKVNNFMMSVTKFSSKWRYFRFTDYHDILIALLLRYLDCLMQDCSTSSAIAMEIPQSCSKSSMCTYVYDFDTWCSCLCVVPYCLSWHSQQNSMRDGEMG